MAWQWILNNTCARYLRCLRSVAPETVTITGHEQAKAGEEKTLTCTSSPSNPASTITWFSRSRQLDGATESVEESPEVDTACGT